MEDLRFIDVHLNCFYVLLAAWMPSEYETIESEVLGSLETSWDLLENFALKLK